MLHGAITSTTALHVSILAAMQTVSQGIHSTRRDLILEPLAGSWYDESRFSGGNLMASCTPQESQGILHHTVGFWPWPLLWLQICKYAKRQRAKGRKCRPKGRAQGQTTRATALYSPFLYSLSKSKPQPRSMHTRRVTNISPSALRCHHTVREQKSGTKQAGGWDI